MKFRSIRYRLTIWYSVALSLSLILSGLVLWIALRHLLNADLSTNLSNELEGFERYMRLEEADPTFNIQQETAEYSASLLQGHILILCNGEGAVLYRSLPDVSPGMFHSAAIHLKHHRYLGAHRRFQLRQGTFEAFLAIDSNSVAKATNLFAWLLFGATPLFICCGIGGGYFLSRRALLPVAAIVEKAKGISVANLSERLPVPDTRDELQALTETWNGMLTRLETAIGKISGFTADASHELRTPVAIIRLAAESALRKPRSDQDYRTALEKIQRESENMTRLIEDLLFLARADVNEIVSFTDRVGLSSLAREVCSDFRLIAAAKGIAINEGADEGSIFVYGSSPDLRRLLIIFLDNAVKYTDSGGTIRLMVAQDGGEAVIEVEDNGVGIPKDAQARVFERFYRVDSSRSKESGGYGLGLAIAAAIVRQHGGTIAARPRAGSGSVFSVRLGRISARSRDCRASE